MRHPLLFTTVAAASLLAGCSDPQRNNSVLVRNRTDLAIDVAYDHVYVQVEDTDDDAWDDTVYAVERLETRIPARSEWVLSVADDDGSSAVDARYLGWWRHYDAACDDGFGIVEVRIEDFLALPTGNG